MRKLDCILLIEDNEFINIYNRRIIEQLNIAAKIEIVVDGQEGIDYLLTKGKSQDNNCIPDLILLDLNMPRLNGWEFVKEYIRIKNQIEKEIVIIVLSTSPNPDDLRRSEDIPEIAAFISKPLTRETLSKVLSRHFMTGQAAK